MYCAPVAGCGSAGCASVVSVLFELAEDPDTAEKTNAFLETVWSAMPDQEGVSGHNPWHCPGTCRLTNLYEAAAFSSFQQVCSDFPCTFDQIGGKGSMLRFGEF